MPTRPPTPLEARILVRLSYGRWRPTPYLGGDGARARLHRMARLGFVACRPGRRRRGFEWRANAGAPA